MPHNLYLHSSIVQTRKYGDTRRRAARAPSASRPSTRRWRSDVALFINAAILIVAAATFHGTGHEDVAEIEDAYKLLTPLLGTTLASTLFAVALLCSGQNATLTGTLAGQIVMEGFLNIRLRPWLRRLITRLIAIVPAVIVIAIYGERGTGTLLILSQVILSLQLPFAVFPLVRFTSRPAEDGPVRRPCLDAGARVAGRDRHRRPERVAALAGARRRPRRRLTTTVYSHILVAIEHSAADATILAHVSHLAKLTGAALLLVHVADGWAARAYDDLALRESEEMQADRAYLAQVAGQLRGGRDPVGVAARARRSRPPRSSRRRRRSTWTWSPWPRTGTGC